MTRSRLGIVIPTRNEEHALPESVARLRDALRQAGYDDSPIVIADCRSTDATLRVARTLGCDVVTDATINSRARAMNAGAEWLGAQRLGAKRSGDCDPANHRADVLWFVHADTHVTTGVVAELQRVLSDPRVVAGAFAIAWQSYCSSPLQRAMLATIRMGSIARYRISGRFYGDQTLFVRREAFEAVGGFRDRLLLEDLAICRDLRKLGRLSVATGPVYISPRRFLRHGVMRQLLFDCVLLTCDGIGVQPVSLYRRYLGYEHPSVRPILQGSERIRS